MRKILSVLSLTAILSVSACDDILLPDSIDIPQESMEYFNNGISFTATAAEGTLTVKISFNSSVAWSATVGDSEAKPVTWLTVNPA